MSIFNFEEVSQLLIRIIDHLYEISMSFQIVVIWLIYNYLSIKNVVNQTFSSIIDFELLKQEKGLFILKEENVINRICKSGEINPSQKVLY